MILEHRSKLEAAGWIARRRSAQAVEWMCELVSLGLEDALRRSPSVAARLPGLRESVERSQVTPFAASREVLRLFRSGE